MHQKGSRIGNQASFVDKAVSCQQHSRMKWSCSGLTLSPPTPPKEEIYAECTKFAPALVGIDSRSRKIFDINYLFEEREGALLTRALPRSQFAYKISSLFDARAALVNVDIIGLCSLFLSLPWIQDAYLLQVLCILWPLPIFSNHSCLPHWQFEIITRQNSIG